jgi:hypothetical protein
MSPRDAARASEASLEQLALRVVTVSRLASYPDFTTFTGLLFRLHSVEGAFRVVIKERLPVQRASPLPIEGRRTGAPLGDSFRTPWRVIGRFHINQ